ncbi:hypothetical protein [Virgisporangium aurantiacum]|uniref:Uridine kinase n=1 Tax=Virgisporangium aurantiacum TaxID=175570 RepID=A0A8J3Z2E7_9ACTN|nr:hypothetical protein [Virgisporangium aurantiacum]GIJ55068.1 hypothetical protein Vau01_025840 [Virgisporangium aurantiacum]
MKIAEFAAQVLAHVGVPDGRPAVLAVDGRSASGKSTLAGRLAAEIPGAVVVHTDDIAWWHAVLDWVDLLVDGVLAPVHRGEAVSYRPPKWDERGRPGAVEVPAGSRLVIVEGVGAGRREVAGWLDGIVWVGTDPALSARRDAARIAAGETDTATFDAWMAEEIPFVADQRTWERAFAVVDGGAPNEEIVLR